MLWPSAAAPQAQPLTQKRSHQQCGCHYQHIMMVSAWVGNLQVGNRSRRFGAIAFSLSFSPYSASITVEPGRQQNRPAHFRSRAPEPAGTPQVPRSRQPASQGERGGPDPSASAPLPPSDTQQQHACSKARCTMCPSLCFQISEHNIASCSLLPQCTREPSELH